MEEIIKKMENFEKRWNINSSNNDFDSFKIRAMNLLKGIDNKVSKNDISKFCFILGIEEKYSYINYDEKTSFIIISYFDNCFNLINFLKGLEVLFSFNINFGNLVNLIADAIKLSKIDVKIYIDKKTKEISFFKAGEIILDKKVNEVLDFLENKPKEHLIKGLKFFKNTEYINSIGEVRRCLEEFLKIKFNNKKGLKANISNIPKNKTESQIRNIIQSIISYLNQYFDKNEKHEDGKIINREEECEFIIYQVISIIYYLNKI